MLYLYIVLKPLKLPVLKQFTYKEMYILRIFHSNFTKLSIYGLIELINGKSIRKIGVLQMQNTRSCRLHAGDIKVV